MGLQALIVILRTNKGKYESNAIKYRTFWVQCGLVRPSVFGMVRLLAMPGNTLFVWCQGIPLLSDKVLVWRAQGAQTKYENEICICPTKCFDRIYATMAFWPKSHICDYGGERVKVDNILSLHRKWTKFINYNFLRSDLS